jgi:hypothetical protein
MTVIIVPVMPVSSVRASSAVPWKASGESGPMFTCDSSSPSSSAATTQPVGITHNDPRAYSRAASHRMVASHPPRLPDWCSPR